MSAERPTGTVTFLFTDIEGSTKAWEGDEVAMAAAVEAHDTTMAEVIAANDGYVFATGGDGFAVAFADPVSAAKAAITAQRLLDLPVRMGMNTGVAHERGGDYFGSAVNRAARVAGAGHGRQILVSQASADLLAADDSISLLELGSHVLKDLTQPQPIFQLAAEGLEADFPPIRSLDSFPTNLPVQRSSFVGRDSLIVDIENALTTSRTVTLTGVGGVGKTRVALQAAGLMLSDFRDGVWLCELAAVNDEDGAVEVVATALEVRDVRGESLRDGLLGFLRHRTTLIVLDNCEHLLDVAADLVDDISSSCPAVSVLATSREGLAIEGERIIAVPALGLPSAEVSARSAEAVRLFAIRAQDRDPTFELSDSNSDAVAQLCTGLDGIPLALELAAARMSMMTPAELVTHLDERFDLLTGGRRRRRDRHQTLRHVIDWSYELLDDNDRAVFSALAVFATSFDLDGALAVTAHTGLSRSQIIDSLGSLVDKSLVVSERHDGRSTYRYLETVRLYAEEQLENQDGLNSALDGLAEYLTAWVGECVTGLTGPDEPVWIERLDAMLPNLRRVFDQAMDRSDLSTVAALLAPFGQVAFGAADRVNGWAHEATSIPDLRKHEDAALLYAMAGVHVGYAGEWLVAEPLAYLALEATRERDSPSAVPFWVAQAFVGVLGRLEEACDLASEGLAAAEASGEIVAPVGLMTGLATYGTLLNRPDALAHGHSALDVARRTGNPTAIALAHYGLGHAYRLDDPLSALAYFSDGCDVAEAARSTLFEQLCAEVACLAAAAGRDDEVLDRSIGTLREMRSSLVALAILVALSPRMASTGYESLASEVLALGRDVPNFRTTWGDQYQAISDRCVALGVRISTTDRDSDDVRSEVQAWLDDQ